MDASLSLRRPNNWQDFETLCKKLWGEIWDCPEIKKNGRTGQTQHGVDVYGIPFGEDKYYGIQCKGKDEYTNKQFSEEEIKDEIEKAKLFQPPLKKLYFATTAVKDAGIEEFIRKQNIENITYGLFEVHIFSWEDIVDLIDENKRTHDFYVKSQNFKTKKSVAVTFKDSLPEITLTPRYKKTITHYKQKIVPAQPYNNPLAHILAQQEKFNKPLSGFNVPTVLSGTKINLSYCRILFEIHNTGIDPIEEYKLFFSFDGEVLDLKESNKENYGIAMISAHQYVTDVYLWTESMSGKVVPKKTILVGDDTFVSDDIFIKTVPNENEIIVNWKLISKDFKDEGQLKILVKPDFERAYQEFLVEDPLKVGTKESDFEEMIIDK
ncbi:hypothetical protein [Flavobacterium quisquiliarum]|uniref:Restriction endonuclease n=1 Tax=Flavobacterium quisquiliarum TaxID=1834436 RepID=A0ABV8W5T8_9FLAO|nr:hypothetical protein [Flavobacterium quisquiliarum]MBW1656890.1 hypothetical protein [Flavobacterium quisquiliarum]